jgi:hypothetical protein
MPSPREIAQAQVAMHAMPEGELPCQCRFCRVSRALMEIDKRVRSVTDMGAAFLPEEIASILDGGSTAEEQPS